MPQGTAASTEIETNVFLFWPNIIGYCRIILALSALGIAFKSWSLMCICYTISQILDAADGHIARMLGQATIFGSVLDQVTDRLSTVGILLLDIIVYPQYYYIFALVLIFDLGGHWVHTFASMLAGFESHKKIPSAWRILKLYYESKVLMFACHASNEVVWVAIFVLSQQPGPLMTTFAQIICIPASILCFFKNVTNLMQMLFGAHVLVSIDLEKRNPEKLKDR